MIGKSRRYFCYYKYSVVTCSNLQLNCIVLSSENGLKCVLIHPSIILTFEHTLFGHLWVLSTKYINHLIFWSVRFGCKYLLVKEWPSVEFTARYFRANCFFPIVWSENFRISKKSQRDVFRGGNLKKSP